MTADERIAHLEAENRQLRSSVVAAQAALQELRLAWCMERLGRADRVEAPAHPAPVLAWKAK